jgi:hypothetical protein
MFGITVNNMAEKLTYVEVVTKQLYAIPTRANGATDEENVQEWFRDYPLDSYHATRDSSRVGGSTQLVSATIVSEKEVIRDFVARGKKRTNLPLKG